METEHRIIIPDTPPQTLIMLIGLPGCGKSTFAKTCVNQHNDWVHLSSDDIRFNENITDNQTVFNLMYQRTKQSLKDKKTVIYDATNLNRKKRFNFIQEFKHLAKHIIYYVFIEPYEECLTRNNSRQGLAVVPDDSMLKMLKNFQIPMEYEKYDEMHWIKTTKGQPVKNFIEQMKGFDQESYHHHHDLYTHSLKTKDYICHNTSSNNAELCTAALYHDIGKLMTKTFTNMKGETTDTAHYYGHENAGAYLFLSNETALSFDTQLNVAKYINWHMRPFQWTTYKIIQKDTELLGQGFIDDITLLNQADEYAT